MKKIGWAMVFGLGLVMMTAPVFAASVQETLTVNAAVSARAKLTLGVAAINFADADPDAVPSIGATENPVSVEVKIRTGASSTATLEHLAAGPLTSGTDTIAISNVTWTAGGNGFVGGTMDSATPQSAGSWTGSGDRSSTFSFSFANSWNYAAGNYTATSTYTLTAP